MCIRERVEGHGSIFLFPFRPMVARAKGRKGLKREEERALNMREKRKGLSSKRAAKRRERREESNPSYWMVCITTQYANETGKFKIGIQISQSRFA